MNPSAEGTPTVDQMIAALREGAPDLVRAAEYLQIAKELIVCLIENDPDESISDAGHTVLDLWRYDARTFLDLPHPKPVGVDFLYGEDA